MQRNRFAILLGVSLVLPLQAAAAFSDVSADHPNADAINYVQSAGIVSGYADGTYRPNQTINRAEFTKIIVGATRDASNIDSCNWESMGQNLSDIPSNAWFTKYVCVARMDGIIAGYPDGTFGPSKPINFVEAAKILALQFNVQGAALDDSVWYRPYVMGLEKKRAIPTSIAFFDQKLTRGEMAEMIFRLKTGNVDKPSLSYTDFPSDTSTSTLGEIPDGVTALFTRSTYPVDLFNFFISGSFAKNYTKVAYVAAETQPLDQIKNKILEDVTSLHKEFLSLVKNNYTRESLTAFHEKDYFDIAGKLYDNNFEPFTKEELATIAQDKFEEGIHWLSIDFQIGNPYPPNEKLLALFRPLKFFVMTNRSRGPDYDSIADLQVSADGNIVAYIARQNGKEFVVINGAEGKSYDHVATLRISPDSQTVLYTAVEGDVNGDIGTRKHFLVTNTKEWGPYNDWFAILTPVFSPDGKSILYAERDGTAHIAFVGKAGDKPFAFDGIKNVYDTEPGEWPLVWGEKSTIDDPHPPIENYQGTTILVHSADNKHVSFGAQKENKWLVVIDGKEGESYDAVWLPVFSPDGTHVIYGALQGRNFYRAVVPIP